MSGGRIDGPGPGSRQRGPLRAGRTPVILALVAAACGTVFSCAPPAPRSGGAVGGKSTDIRVLLDQGPDPDARVEGPRRRASGGGD